MYTVKYGSEYLHDPRDDKRILTDLSLECEENSCGFCDFTIYPNHPMYNKIRERDTENQVEVYEDDILLFAGFIYELGKEFYLDGHVKCKGELDYLNETIVRPYSTVERGFGSKAPTGVDDYFAWLIDQHNSQVGPNKQFVVGKNEGHFLDKNNYIYRQNDRYPKTLDEIKDKLINNENAGGYIRIRHEDGVRYIDYLAEWDNTNSQVLDFGVNLTDYNQTDDTLDVATFIVPLGATLDNTEYEYNDGYYQSEDTQLDRSKQYYTLSINYSYCGYITEFEEGVTYYEKVTKEEVDNGSVDTTERNCKYFETTDETPNPTKRYYYLRTNGEFVSDSEIESKAIYGYVSTFADGYTYYEKNKAWVSTETESGSTYTSTTEVYVETEDTTTNARKLYYIQTSSYSAVGSEVIDFEEGVTYYEYYPEYDESNLLLTIEGVGDGQYSEDLDYYIYGDKIYSASAVQKYGWVGITTEDSEIVTKEDLRDLGVLTLKSYVSPKRTIEIKAVDMHFINKDLKPIMVGEYVRVRSVPHNLDTHFICRSIDLDLNNPGNSLYTLGDTFDTLTGQQNKMIKALNETVRKQNNVTIASKTIF